MTTTTKTRPGRGWVGFAAILLMVAGTMQFLDGLWAIRFGNSVTGGNHTLLFSAGIDDETHGLLGAIRFHP